MLEQTQNDSAGCVHPCIDVDRANDRLQRPAQIDRSTAAAGMVLAAAQHQQIPQIQVFPDARQRSSANQLGAHLCQLTLGQIREAVIELLGNHKSKHSIAEELHSFIRSGKRKISGFVEV